MKKNDNLKYESKKMNKLTTASMLAASLLLTAPVQASNTPQLSGALEVEISSGEDFAGAKESDIALATVELAIDGNVNKRVDYHIGLLYEDGDDGVNLDEAFFTIKPPRSSMSITAGQMVIPFGNYSTAMVSDPLTLEMGETHETVVQVGFESKNVSASIYAFNGDLGEAGNESAIDDVGFNLNYTLKSKRTEMDFGIGYINNFAETNGVSDYLLNVPVPPITDIQKKVAAMTVHAVMNFRKSQFIVEYLTASEQFDVADLAFKGAGAEPKAYNIEYSFTGDINFGVAYQKTEEAVALGLPESKVLATVSTELYENTGLSFEYSSSDDYSVADGGTGESANAMVMKLDVSF